LRILFGFFTEGNEENEDFRSGGGQSLCFLCCLLFRKDSAIGAVRFFSKKAATLVKA